MMEKEFGYLPAKVNIVSADLTIENIENPEIISDGPNARYWRHKDWAYPPRNYSHNFSSQDDTELPSRIRVFELPKTHRISSTIPSDSEDRIKFIVWIFGFFLGIRLTTEEAGFVDGSPLVLGKLTDGYVHPSNYEKVIDKAIDFYNVNVIEPKLLQLCVGAIHTYFMSFFPQAFFHERFANLYASLDALSELTRLKNGVGRMRHGARVDWMCGIYSIQTPAWAVPDSNNATTIATLRNENFHEALFTGGPLGYIVPGHGTAAHVDINLCSEMQKLVSRIIVALIVGSNIGYVTSGLDSRMQQLIEL